MSKLGVDFSFLMDNTKITKITKEKTPKLTRKEGT